MIPIFDGHVQYEKFAPDIDRRIAKVLKHGRFIQGPEVRELEGVLESYTGAGYCISCGNGTDAIQIALMALGITSGDEVIVPGFSYIATAEAPALLGATVVFADINLKNYSVDVACVESLITERTKAIIGVSLYGLCSDYDVLNEVASRHGIPVIEDAAQSFGGEFMGKKSCNLTTIGCTSFFPTKPLGCYGDGGAIFTSDPELAEKIRMIAQHGQRSRYEHEILGVNSRLDTVQAAVLLSKINLLDDEIARREIIANEYSRRFRAIGAISTPDAGLEGQSAWAQYTIRVEGRDNLAEKLRSSGIASAVHYPKPLYRQKASFQNLSLPRCELASRNVLSIPINTYGDMGDVEYVADTIIKLCD